MGGTTMSFLLIAGREAAEEPLTMHKTLPAVGNLACYSRTGFVWQPGLAARHHGRAGLVIVVRYRYFHIVH